MIQAPASRSGGAFFMETIVRSPLPMQSAFQRAGRRSPSIPQTGAAYVRHDARAEIAGRQRTDVQPVTFPSVLFKHPEASTAIDAAEMPAFFVDLNLDQIVDAITAGREEYGLKPFFYMSLHDVDSIEYRHEVMQDLENEALWERIKSFAEKMRVMRSHLAQTDKLYYQRQKERWFLQAVTTYCEAVTGLFRDLSQTALQSRGLLAFKTYLADYLKSEHFTSLLAQTQGLVADLASITYCLHIKEGCIRVRKCEGEVDYSADVEKTFEKFKSGTVKSYRVQFPDYPQINHVEAGILDLVAQLHPDIFHGLEDYCANNKDYLDETVAVFDREIQFYLACLEFIARLKLAGLKFCYPEVSADSKAVFNRDGFDLALANKLVGENSPVVCNDFYLRGKERIFVISGPNQGGKTTFARTFGQLHYMSALGCPVPGGEARLFLFDRLFTHFEREESINNLRGKLQDDLVRIHAILDQASPSSIIVMNEIFTSTTLQDAVFLGKKVMEKVIDLDLLCVCVTFVDELASLSEKTVSMVSTVTPENTALRTFKIVRRPADGLAYALSIAEKFRLTYNHLKERVKS
jgi:DNA mismatch repair protein MutS